MTVGASVIPFIFLKEEKTLTAAADRIAASILAFPAKFSNPPKHKFKVDRINPGKIGFTPMKYA